MVSCKTSFQFGGALVLAVATAVNNANTGASAQGLLDGFQAAVLVSVLAAAIGAAVMAVRSSPEPAAVLELDTALEAESEAEAA